MLSHTERTQIRKAAHKAVQEPQALYDIIDESLMAHVAICDAHGPVVIPMLAWRVDEYVYIHGANNSRLIRHLKQAEQSCLTFTLFDGWVLARSAFHHSAHYRSALVFGPFETVEDNAEKDRVLNHFVEQIAPGRTQDVRLGNDKELTATSVLRMPLTEASVKISNGPVHDDRADLAVPAWAGFIPYRTVVGPLKAAADLHESVPTPDYSAAYGSRWVK
ncbi:pyridoxamine 5'-phosphate oxidase family protein [Photobacterium sp. GJ3]|uniref:pyridoxamine 5'-phosphate oxidase family protein n=1 Tax=Photobacterium sp. GJ3 TaxID=2829502 RepID=UPI001B8AA6C2|nr:pyridoxamine 5'-phosphate oxidase family protein [Photobacterium sp. GJ3]QUJ67833.1 pyridoxamine 5'-phosphate oxidase family protein [Photobacterium sp. GJ3]